MNGEFDEILPQFHSDRLADGRGIEVAEHAECARRSHDDQRRSFALAERDVESVSQRCQECPLFLVVPVGLLDIAAGRTD
jgi:hypothetical protein